MLIVAESATVVKWLVQDHLGSTRMEIGVGGASGDVLRHDYLPFGEELAGSMRSAANGYGPATNTKQKFTGYERDSETGLDFAQARYLSSVQGRFTSVDPDGVGAALIEPQSWNGYSYVGNRPTALTDPSGLKWYQHTNKNGKTDLQWSDTGAPGKGWTEVVFNGDETQYYESHGSIYAISRNDPIAHNLTADAINEARAIRSDLNRKQAEERVNAVIRDFIVYSVLGGAVAALAAPVTIAEAIKVAALTVAADRLDDRTGGLYSAATVVAGAAAPKLLARFNSVESLIGQAGTLQRLKGGARKGSIQGDADDIFNVLAIQYGAKVQIGENGYRYFKSGDIRVGMHNSAKEGGLPTLDININGSITKIRVTQ